jgi:peptidoglycan/xylan/chitin deacetylase (PgdA/CDA1 family)
MPLTAHELIPVLLYHAVSDESPADQPGYTVSRRRFTEHVEVMIASGRRPVGFADLAGALRGERKLPPRAFVVTFDDGFPDTPAAAELLQQQGIPSTVYITADRLGDAEAPVSPPTLAALMRMEGVEIGAHSVTHPYLDELDPAALRHEVGESRRLLEAATGRQIATFAYPHGAFDARVRQAVVEAGYTSAAAVKNAIAHLGEDPMAIARWTVRSDTSAQKLATVLEGRGAPVAWQGERARTRAYRSLRRLRRRALPLGRHDG